MLELVNLAETGAIFQAICTWVAPSVGPVVVLKADSDAGRALRLCGVYSPELPRTKMMTEWQRAASTDACTIGAEIRQ
jgi:hypothetical protein